MKKFIITILALSFSLVGWAQQHQVSGKVVDERGEGLPGSYILVKGGNVGVVTDVDGNYRLDKLSDTDVLIFSFLGYKSQEIAIAGRSVVDVNLEPEATSLQEVVVVGYSEVKKRDVTGAVGQVDTEDIMKTATSNFDQALAGRIAGVQVTASDGTPGGAAQIVIRGGNSITGDNSPLYVIDGVPYEGFDPASLSSQDIKSFDVLKDASATAIYGSRGANGVIVITTKGGRTDGKTDVHLGISQGVQYIPKRLEVLSPYQYAKYQENVAYAKDGYGVGTYTNQYRKNWGDPEAYKGMEGTSWQDEIFREASLKKYSLSMNGGNKTTSIYYSGEYVDQEGTLVNTGFKKIINNLKFTHKLNDKLQVRGALQYSYINRSGINISGNTYTSIIRDAIQFRPIDPINDDGLIDGYDENDPQFQYLFNPLKNLQNTTRNYRYDVIRGNVDLIYKIIKGLTFKASGGFQSDNRKENVFYGAETQQGFRGNDHVNGTITNRRYQTLTTSNTLNYKVPLSKAHDLQVLGGFEGQARLYDYAWLKSSEIPTDAFGIDNLGLGTSPAIPQTFRSENTLLSYFGRVSYSLNDKYLLTANFRADGSSKFLEENRWGYFPSFAMAWRLGDEEFMKPVGIISDLKVRAGWGLTGNNRIGDYDAYNLLGVTTSSGYVWGTGETYVPGAQQTNLGVPDLRWETTAQSNIGVDFGFMAQRVQGSVDVYLKRTKDLLLNAEMSLSTGFDKVRQNIGEVENKGLEISLTSTNVRSGKFEWRSNFNIAFNRNKVIQLNEGQEAIYTDPEWNNGFAEYQYITKVGEPVGQVFGLVYDGLYQMDDFVWDAQTNNYILKEDIPDNGTSPVAPGSIKYVDVNGDGTINIDDRQIIGNTQAKHTGGFSNDFRLGGFDLQVFFQWSYGAEILNGNQAAFATPSGSSLSGFPELLDAWTPLNTDTDVNTVVYNLVYGAPPKGNQISDRYIEDGSFIRLKTVSLGYNLPASLLERIKVKSCRISVSAQNLKTWTNYSGYDPEVSVGKFGALTPNLDYSAYPQSVTISGGLDITF
ncbi:TonB-dependent receptor [Reichenbachiella carrageenanivorans]|uniref:TonB-dependent receptor n=1 Tax=Reichenbachiella carrageenanivorans TaxID=2979869 RepID=A0ABY6D575_9BACT|nr:TonB-dependent receptor [Reichenbachiella carrageenanivorans]UXX81292.1 TonB-dependent receptor [Reichenbachiella carrageenanivorans]